MRSDTVRVVTYNVHGFVGRDRRFDPERILRVLEPLAADFIALQEVEDRMLDGRPISDHLALQLGMHAFRGRTLSRGDADYGNLLLARGPAIEHRVHDLSVPGREPRGAVEAEFLSGRSRLRFFATHLGLTGRERLEQVRRLSPALERNDADVVVLAGDINEWRPAAPARRLLARVFGTTAAGRTFPAAWPALSLDRVYVSPGHALESARPVRHGPARLASDHLPLVADLRITADAPS